MIKRLLVLSGSFAILLVVFFLLVRPWVLVLRRRDWRRPLLGFVVAAAAFEWLTLGQPPLVIGTALTLAVAAVLW